jgi:hypothetical protein
VAAPVFVAAGAGAERLTTGTVSVTKATCTAGNLVIFHNFFSADTGDGGFTNFANVQALDGTINTTTALINAVNRQVLLARVTADGTCSADLSIGASGDDGVGRIYEFSSVSAGTTLASVVENGTGTNVELGFSASTTINDSDVTTNGIDRVALNFVNVRSAAAIGAFTGETGGDWTEQVAEYSGTTLMISLQSSPMPAAGVIDGGTITITSAYWVTIGTALRPPVAQQTYPFDAIPFMSPGRI